MSYIPFTSNTMERDTRHDYRYVLPINGVKLSMSEADFEEGKCRFMQNLNINTNSLSTVFGKERMFESFEGGKKLYSITKEDFCGKIVMHIDNCLYSFDKNSTTPEKITDILPDAQSLFLEFLSKLYIYSERHVYSLDNTFTFKEEEPFAPVIFKNMMPTSPNYAEKYKEKVPLNLIAPRITVEFTDSDSSLYLLPYKIDTTRNFDVFIDEKKLNPDEYIIGDKRLTLKKYTDYVGLGKMRITYYVENFEDMGFEDVFSKCTLSTVYGGNNLSGTRAFVTGNPDKKGVYYKSELLDPLYFHADEFEIVGDGCYGITGMIKMYDALIVFTEKAVYRMLYSQDGAEVIFTIKMISSQLGCDIPKSIELVDNRVVFANSKKGIFILDSQEESGEQNIKPLSGNITRNGNSGFLDCDESELKNACSIDFDRKYILCVKNRAFVWDYDKCSYSESYNYAKAQNRLVFTLMSLDNVEYLLNLSGTLCACSAQNPVFSRYDAPKNNVAWSMLSGRMDFGFSYNKKQVTDMEIVLKREKDAVINLKLYSQGTQYYTTALYCQEDKSHIVKLKLPAKKLEFFEFELCGTGGVEIYAVRIKYTVV